MNKNVKMMFKVGGFGLAGVMAFSAPIATAAEFGVTAEVQNALTVTPGPDMDLGTIFATGASDAESAFFTLAPNGDVSAETAAASGDFQILSLGTPVPGSATIAVGSQASFTVTLPDATTDGAVANTGVNAFTGSSAPVYLCAGGACGNAAIARFELVNFTIDEFGTATATTTGGQTSNQVEVTPGFGATEVSFNIGVTVVTDGDRDTSRTPNATSGLFPYEATTYTGTYEVTASY